MKMKKSLKNKNHLKYYKFLVQLIVQKSIRKFKIMPEENINQEFRLEKIDEIRNDLIEEINWNELMRKEDEKALEFLIILITHLL